MDVPSPGAAAAIADALDASARDVRAADSDLLAARSALAAHWDGHAAEAAGQVLCALDVRASAVQAALAAAGASWHGLAGRLHWAKRAAEAAEVASDGFAVLAVISLVQAGADVATDAASAAAKAAEEGALASARAALATVLGEITTRTAESRAVLLSLRETLLYVGKATGLTVVEDVAGDVYLRGHVRWADVVSPAVAEALVPTTLGRLMTVAGTAFDPAITTSRPSAFPDDDRYAAAVACADSWAARSTDRALVEITGVPGGVVLTVVGGGVAARTGLVPDQAYDTTELPAAAADLGEVLDEIAVEADGTVSVVVR